MKKIHDDDASDAALQKSGVTVNQTATATLAVLPSDYERQQIFFMLQKLSSITAWRRVCRFYEAWSAAAEKSLREADKQGWSTRTSIPKYTCSQIATGLKAMQKGLTRLETGDRHVFKNVGESDDFSIARTILFSAESYLSRIEFGENGIDGKHTPFWREYTDAMKAASQAWLECANHVLEPAYRRDAGLTIYDQALQKALTSMPFPPELARVPDPIDDKFVKTGRWVKCAGIWEPISVEKVQKTSLLDWLKRAPDPAPPFTLAGAMNYLHAYSSAPQIMIETVDGPVHCDTTWRLLWRDDRYLDGIVPEHETDYRFTKPPEPPIRRPVVSESGQTSWAQSGTSTWVSGTWLVEFDLHASVKLVKGDKLPLHLGRTVDWLLAEE